MQENVEVTARTVDEAIEIGLRQLEVQRDAAEIVVLNRGRPGLLGIGSEPARVRVTLRSGHSDVSTAQDILEKLLSLAGIEAGVYVVSSQDEIPIRLDVRGDDAGLLIGRRGATLQQLQTLLIAIVNRTLQYHVPLSIDVEGYMERRMERVRQIALRAAERVQQRRRPLPMDPMPSAERRMVHTTLADHQAVTTESAGTGEDRHVVIYLRR